MGVIGSGCPAGPSARSVSPTRMGVIGVTAPVPQRIRSFTHAYGGDWLARLTLATRYIGEVRRRCLNILSANGATLRERVRWTNPRVLQQEPRLATWTAGRGFAAKGEMMDSDILAQAKLLCERLDKLTDEDNQALRVVTLK